MEFSYEPIRKERILGVDPLARGFGFVILETDPVQLVDWGVTTTQKGPDGIGIAIERLLNSYDPTVFVLEDTREARALRQRALSRFSEATEEVLSLAGITVFRYTRRDIRRAFETSGQFTKQGIAAVLAARFPELALRVPPARKVWESEDSRMSIFDALSLAITHTSCGNAKSVTSLS